jgi:hypothetical protein
MRFCEHSHEPSSSIKEEEEFLFQLSDCELLKKDFAPWIEFWQ